MALSPALAKVRPVSSATTWTANGGVFSANKGVTILYFNSAGDVATKTLAITAVLVIMKLRTTSDTPTSSNTDESSTRACSLK